MPSVASTKAQRIQESRGLRAKAPIAAQFEDCSQASVRLADALQANRQGSDELRNLAQYCNDRLGFWGDDSGASSRVLDYALACSPTLMRQTHLLLADLHSTLEKAVATSRPQLLEGDEAFDFKKGKPIVALLEDEDVDSGPGMYLDEALEIVACLVKLLPALRDPLEEDEEDLASHSWDSYSAEWYFRAIETAQQSFPKVSTTLLRRLGRNHRRRRNNLLRLREKSNRSEGRVGSGRVGRSRTIPQNWPRQLRRRTDAKRSNFADSDAGVSTSQSYVESVLSNPYGDQVSETSVTNSQQASGSQHTASGSQHTASAAPAADNEAAERFDCPICHSEVPLTVAVRGMTLDEWIGHVYLDLKPYVCTFDNCHRGDRAFGTRKEWFQHELDFHRSRTLWSCGVCRKTFKAEKDFVDHLSHRISASENLPYLLESCRRYSQDESSTQCTLCGISCSSMWELEDHVGRHLERYALGAVPNNEILDDGNSESLVREFIDEQEALQEPSDVAPSTETRTIRATSPQRPTGNIAISRVTETSDATGIDDPEKEIKTGNNIPLSEKVHAFLNKMPNRPARSKIPERDEGFVGRAYDLRKIHDYLSATGQICTITGRGGIGKTATAIEYLHRYGSEYSYIFWVESETPGTCQQRYNMIADVLDVGENSTTDENSLTFAVKRCLSKLDSRWLVVFDNVNAWLDISRYIPRNLPNSKGSILITSRSGPHLSGVSAYQHQIGVSLEPWGLNHSREFLLTSISPKLHRDNLREHDEYHLAEKVVEVVDRLPLAVSMVVGYIKVSRCTLAEFLEMWEERATSKKTKKRLDAALEAGIDGTIDSLWDIGIREVRANCRKLLDVLSFLDPEAIQKTLLVGDHEEEYLDFLQVNEKIQYKRMIEQLARQRLITVKMTDDGEAYSIHRVLQQKIQFDMDDYSYADAFRKAFCLIRKKFPYASPTQVPVLDSMEVCNRYMPHVYSFHKVFEEHYNDHNSAAMRETKPHDLAQLFYDAGFFVWARQSTSYDGLSFLDAADNILNKIQYDADAKLRADIHCMTGLLLLNMGYAERARGTQRLKAALQIRKNIYAKNDTLDNDILVQNAANDYALSLMNAYRFGKAGEILKECHERYQTWGPEPENPFENSKFYGNYSAVLLWEGRIDEAVEHINRCLEYTEQFAGRGTQYYRRLFWLANILLQSGDTQAALDKHLEVLKERLKLQGKHNENTILSMYAVGAAFHDRGDLPSAIEHIEQCIDAARSYRIPPEAFGRANYHLALLYEAQGGEPEKVRELKEEAMKIFNEFEHYAPDSLRELGDVMMIFDDMQGTFQGRYTGRRLLEHMRRLKKQPEVRKG